MTSPAVVRPQKVTMACLFIGLSCVILLIGVGSTLSSWGSIETQDEITKMLSSAPLGDADLDVADVLVWLRWVLMAGAAIAAAGVIFAIWTAKGHQASRIILTVMCGLACLIFLAGGLWGILPAAFAIGCGFYLWSPESRRWFAIKNGKIEPEPTRRAADPFAANPGPGADSGTAGTGAESEHGTAPSPVEQPGAGTPHNPIQGGPIQDGPIQEAAGSTRTRTVAYAAPATPTQRPKPVLYAGIVTMVLAAGVGIVCGVNAAAYFLATDTYVSLLEDQPMLQDSGMLQDVGMTTDSFAKFIGVGCAVVALLSLAALAAAVMTVFGNPVGRFALLALCVVTLVISVVGFPVGLPWTAASIAVIVLLLRPESRAWSAPR